MNDGDEWNDEIGRSGLAVIFGRAAEDLRFVSRTDATRAITGWINHYNAGRRHSSNNNMSPIEWELQFPRRQIQAA